MIRWFRCYFVVIFFFFFLEIFLSIFIYALNSFVLTFTHLINLSRFIWRKNPVDVFFILSLFGSSHSLVFFLLRFVLLLMLFSFFLENMTASYSVYKRFLLFDWNSSTLNWILKINVEFFFFFSHIQITLQIHCKIVTKWILAFLFHSHNNYLLKWIQILVYFPVIILFAQFFFHGDYENYTCLFCLFFFFGN